MRMEAIERTSSGSRSKILYLVTEDWYFWSHRLPIARASRDRGFEVVVATRVQSHGDRIAGEGFRVVPLGWRRRSLHPWNEAKALIELVRVYRRERPDIVHHIALKPAVYGSLAARLTGARAVVNTVAGMGYVFTSRELKARLLSPPLKSAFRFLFNRPNVRVIIQNPDDGNALAEYCGVGRDKTVLIRGSGVDLSRFAPRPEPAGRPNVTMVSRMLWDKGVGELVEAAKRLREANDPIDVTLVGVPDPENPASISNAQLEAWQREGLVRWLGYREDVAKVWADSTIAVLPTTYGEGVPKALIEAAACGRAVIATDVPGCREIVLPGESGLLVPPRDSDALLEAIRRLSHDPALRKRMGEKGREHAVGGFSEETVVEQTLALYDSLLGRGSTK
ncbi:MAG: glycosyl transferase, group 1 [Candidatus Krumholzibacteriota bacterium]|nr:glycosyl transferase, group 1 [Candidatus Krumholzibacteriota bacterium]